MATGSAVDVGVGRSFVFCDFQGEEGTWRFELNRQSVRMTGLMRCHG